MYGLEAEILYRSRELEEVLTATPVSIEYEVPHAGAYRVVADGARSRYLRAELERQVGDPLVAWNYYEGIDQSWSPSDTFSRPAA